MSSRSVSSSLSIAERQFQRAQWLSSGKCIRCFHTSKQAKAEEDSVTITTESDSVKPHINTSRQRRHAQITNELSSLATSKKSFRRLTLEDASTNPDEGAMTLKEAIQRKDTTTSKPISRSKTKGARTAVTAPTIDRDELLRLGQGTSTIAGSNYRGVLVDRLRLASTSSPARQVPKSKAQLYCISESETPRYMKAVQEIEEVGTEIEEVDKKKKKEVQSWSINNPDEAVRQSVFEKLVIGKHDGEELFNGKEKFKQPLLNQVARALTMNGSYMAKDTARLVSKVRSLLPATPVVQKKSRATI